MRCAAYRLLEGVVMLGLSSNEAALRLTTIGPNQLVSSPRWRRVRAAMAMVGDPMALMLLVAGAVTYMMGQRIDAVILFAALLPVLGIDVLLEARSQRALAALRAAVAPTAHVLRDGVEHEIPTENIVPGDVLVIREGDLVFADAHVVEGSVTVDESHLTGEAEPAPRAPGDEIHAGSRIVAGRARAEVIRTGAATAYGKIATLVTEARGGATPLQRRIGGMVKKLMVVALVVVALELVVELALGISLATAITASVSLAMAALPEEFTLVFTMFLSLGAARLARRGLLVRRLVSVEALGSTTVICIDKTGTLTHGKFVLDEHVALACDDEALLAAAALACEPNPDDAMEIAIGEHCAEHGVDLHDVQRVWRLVADHPFEAAGRHMTHVWQRGDHWSVAIKGALEGVLEHCAISDEDRARAGEILVELARRGMRVLAVARRDGVGSPPIDRESAERGATLLGLIGFRDPVRVEARAAVEACRRAGIAIKIVTGDHALTARSVAELVGMEVRDETVLTGAELEALPDTERTAALRRANVLARIRPEQKYEIVDHLMRAGEVVAMTGDGINDAPALRRASIGVSMGARATEIARSAAGMILLRDDLGAIVESVREGRHIYANLQRAFLFLVASHTIPVLALALTTPLVGVPILLPIHLVWLELVVHPMAALVFEVEPASPDLMTRPPRAPQEPLLPRLMFARSFASGTVLALAAFAIFVLRRDAGLEEARTAALATVLVGGLAIAWIERRPEVSWWQVGLPSTSRFWIVAVAVGLSLPLALAIPAVGAALHVAMIGPLDLALVLAASFLAIGWRISLRPSLRASR